MQYYLTWGPLTKLLGPIQHGQTLFRFKSGVEGFHVFRFRTKSFGVDLF